MRSGNLLRAIVALTHFRDLHPCGAMQLLQTGAREALDHELNDVSAIAKHQLVPHLGSSPPHHDHVGVRPSSSRTLIVQQIATSFCARLWNHFSPSIAESWTKTFRANRSSKFVARDRSLSFFRTSGKRDNDWKHNAPTVALAKIVAFSKKPSPARQFMKEIAGPSCGIRGGTASMCSREEVASPLLVALLLRSIIGSQSDL